MNGSSLAISRVGAAMLAGVVTLVVARLVGAKWPVALTSAWGIAALVIVSWVWLQVGGMDAEQTKADARTEDFSRPLADGVVLTACLASLFAIGYTLITAGNRTGWAKAMLLLLALGVVAVSWLTVHTLYLLRYGDTYYSDPVGGIDFNDDEPPDYRDFAYVALTIGVTFQVSDTSLTSKRMRHLAIRQALLSFLFVAVFGSLAINAVASLLH